MLHLLFHIQTCLPITLVGVYIEVIQTRPVKSDDKIRFGKMPLISKLINFVAKIIVIVYIIY